MRHEPLASYLEPQFGNIYIYNLVEQDGFDVQPWTDELRQAVKHYFGNEVTDDEYAAFLTQFEYEVPLGGREGQVEAIMEIAEVWEIAYSFHLAAVTAVPTLDELIGHLKTWPYEDERWDAAAWLDAHTSREQFDELSAIADHRERYANRSWPSRSGQDVTEKLTPLELVTAWHQVIGPAESDLTDDEWQLLLPVLPQWRLRWGNSRQRSAQELRSLRAALDGMGYKDTYGVHWSNMPSRYGKADNIYQRYCRYQRDGVFMGMLEALRGRPGAARAADWLNKVSD